MLLPQRHDAGVGAIGYERALKHYPKRFNSDNLALVPFAIRKEAFSVPLDKKINRRNLGFDENKFTVVLFDGGYGIGKMGSVTEILAQSDLDITLVPVCGKNRKLYDRLKDIKPSPSVDLRVYGFSDRILEILGAADIFLGKSGASSVAEPCFFGVPEIITSYATQMEQHNAHYYIDYVGNAVAHIQSKGPRKGQILLSQPRRAGKAGAKGARISRQLRLGKNRGRHVGTAAKKIPLLKGNRNTKKQRGMTLCCFFCRV